MPGISVAFVFIIKLKCLPNLSKEAGPLIKQKDEVKYDYNAFLNNSLSYLKPSVSHFILDYFKKMEFVSLCLYKHALNEPYLIISEIP